MKTAKLQLTVEYDEEVTDPDSISAALDKVLETGLSTPGILDEVGCPEVGEFWPLEEDPRKG